MWEHPALAGRVLVLSPHMATQSLLESTISRMSSLSVQIGKTKLECFQVVAKSGSYHDPVGIDGVTVTAVALAGADSGVEAVFG